ncbi:hypothetical protein [Nocardioides flavescens]|uniref:TPM domain-containing protein n=1 Tax=Nocardioides flavescens TaxID=2691959 RepID=A0A6L7F0E1_9ACTN|nr:hypothetical protein [Nocardioides flavescens]MXG89881.1 hypothetical protein [Nocardioides flavescens]
MRRVLALTCLLLLPVMAALAPASARAASTPDPYVAAAVDTWRGGDPVFVSAESGAVSPDDAADLRARIVGWRDDVFVAVLPALALRQSATDDDVDEASALLDQLYAGLGRDDALLVVAFSGAGTYAAGYGDAPGADDLGRIVAEELDAHTLGQVDQVLEGTLDRLGAPAPDDGVSAWWVAAAVLAGAALATAATLGVVRWRRGRPRTRPSGETWAGAAAYRPSFTVYGDQSDTVEHRAALAREDVTRLGEELDAADPPLDDPTVAAHVQAALDAYADASRRVDGLSVGLSTDDELRALGEVTEFARWQLACARAALTGATPPARRVPCFVDAAHGVSVADVSWAPPGGTLRPVPVCRACFDRITGGAA